jgi:hypothetical protein
MSDVALENIQEREKRHASGKPVVHGSMANLAFGVTLLLENGRAIVNALSAQRQGRLTTTILSLCATVDDVRRAALGGNLSIERIPRESKSGSREINCRESSKAPLTGLGV